MRYKNKIDLWISILLIGSVVMFIPLMFTVPEDEMFILVITGVFMALLIFPFFFGYIELGDDEITIRLSVFRKKIKYDDIKSIRMCTNLLSSMSMTKDRIEIKTHGKGTMLGTTYIGPQDREEFFELLQRRCRNLE